MSADAFIQIDEKIQNLIHDTKEYGFEELKVEITKILQAVDIFKVDDEVNPQAIDMYLKSVINARNSLKKQVEEQKLEEQREEQNSGEEKLALIDTICQSMEFESKEALLTKVDELAKLPLEELQKMANNS